MSYSLGCGVTSYFGILPRSLILEHFTLRTEIQLAFESLSGDAKMYQWQKIRMFEASQKLGFDWNVCRVPDLSKFVWKPLKCFELICRAVAVGISVT